MVRHHGHHAGAVSVAELLNRQVKPCRPELPHRAPQAIDPPIKPFRIDRDPGVLARVLAGLRRLA
jgi:hypothetical protein